MPTSASRKKKKKRPNISREDKTHITSPVGHMINSPPLSPDLPPLIINIGDDPIVSLDEISSVMSPCWNRSQR